MSDAFQKPWGSIMCVMLSIVITSVGYRYAGILAPEGISLVPLMMLAGAFLPFDRATARSAVFAANTLIGRLMVLYCSPAMIRCKPARESSCPVTRRVEGSITAF